MSRDRLTAIPGQAVEHACATEPHAVLPGDQDAVHVDGPHRQTAVVHALERRRDLNDIAPDDAFRQSWDSAAHRDPSCAGTAGTDRSCWSSAETTRSATARHGMCRVMLVVAKRCRPRVRRKRSGGG